MSTSHRSSAHVRTATGARVSTQTAASAPLGRARFRALPLAATIGLATLLLAATTACTSAAPADGGPQTSTSLSTEDTADASATRPSPGATLPPVTAPPASADRLASFTVRIVAADDALSASGTAAAIAFAEQNGADVEASVSAAGDDDAFAAHLEEAVAAAPSVILTVGPNAVDLVDSASANNLGQLFLLVGAQLPEPTANVTAAVWPGADSRGTVSMAETSPEAFSAHVDAGLEAGFAAILADETGYVYELPVQ
jgi:ABC-type phosphate transport system substrate-binding protein